MKKLFKVMLLMTISVSAAKAQEFEHVLWEKTPIQITLPINEERMIRFPGPVSIAESELDKSTGIMKFEDGLYLNAKTAFKNRKLILQLMPDGEAIILNISALEELHDARPLEIIMPKREEEIEAEAEKEIKALSDNAAVAATNPSANINPVSLTRFAIQSLYSPARLLVTPKEIKRVAMQTYKTVPLVFGSGVLAHPLISWEAEGLFVTAVELQNTLKKSTVLDPRKIKGEWQAATFFPTNILHPRNAHETTTVFLVSSRPFKDAMSANNEYLR